MRRRLAAKSPEGAPPPAAWRRLSWGLLGLVFLLVAAIAGAAGWSIAGPKGLFLGLALALLVAVVRAAPAILAGIMRRGDHHPNKR